MFIQSCIVSYESHAP